MEIAVLQERINKKQTQIEKINKRLEKWGKDLDSKLKETFYNMSYADFRKRKAEFEHLSYEGQNSLDEYRRASNDLEEAKVQLDKYKNALALEESKAKAVKIQVIVDFLNKWKETFKDFIRKNVLTLKEYYELDSKRCEFHNSRSKYLQNHSLEDYKQEAKRLDKEAKELKQMVNPLTREVYDRKAENLVNEEELEKILSKEVELKYWNMINKVTPITGEITDASLLKIAPDGNINGILIGDKGKARLETIYAGGVNEGIIVNVKHGQCLHFRLLCYELK